ncbi:MAG: 6,7-dimethyl-8-ribityllumazine synthase [Acidobacteria bacterium]|nr:MAG: 6,7-dimethyl-8-ribityllumazine synthase [Acidobacteriota bacterium]
MSDIRRLEGKLDASGRRFGIVAARFNERLVERLIDGAVDCLLRHGAAAEGITLARVPGAWELPPALAAMAASGRCDALIALAVVIRGETPHFDYICAGASQGIAAVAAEHRLPVTFGVLTCGTSQQAEERAGGKAGNKGWEAALAAIEMTDLLAQLRAGG